MDKEAQNIISDHKNPITKTAVTGPKLFLKDSSNEAMEKVSANLENLKKILMHQKVEKRCARAKAEWQMSTHLAKVSKVVKGLLEHFGYQDKTGIYMYPEEMLFLVETNRLEISIDTIPLSVQECYDIALNTPDFSLNKYRVFKKLVLKGYKVMRSEEICRRTNKETITETFNMKKRKAEQLESDSKRTNISSSSEKIEVNKIFEELRKNAPQSYTPGKNGNPAPDFCIFLQNNNSRVNWDYNLYICKDFVLDELKTDHPSIYAICSPDNISFYKIGTVNVPCNKYT